MSDSVDLGSIFASVGLNLAPLEAGVAGVKASVGAVTAELRKVDAAAPGSKLKAGMTPAIAALDQTAASAAKTGKEVTKLGGLNPGAKLGTSIMSVLPALGTLAAGIAALGIGAAKMSADFDTSLNQVRNNTTMSAKDFDAMKKAVIALGDESGASLDGLAQGFMHIMNFGYSSADATNILNAAMKSAVATGSDVADTADVLAKGIHEFGISASKAGEAMNVMHLAAAEGNMTLEQFDQAAGPAMAEAANLGVSLIDVAAAMSALTRHGLDASEAATQVKDVLQHIISPGKEAQKELAELSKTSGVDLVGDFTQAGLKAKGLIGVLQDVATATHGNGEEVYKLIAAQRGGIGAMILAGNGAKDYKDIIESLAQAMDGKVDPSTEGFNRSLNTLNQQAARLTNEIKTDFIPVGEDLVPIFQNAIPFIKGTADVLKDVLTVFTALPTPIQDAILLTGTLKLGFEGLKLAAATLGIEIGGVGTGLIGKFGLLKVAEGEVAAEGTTIFAAASPYMLALAGVALAVLLIKDNWDKAKKAHDDYAAEQASNYANVPGESYTDIADHASLLAADKTNVTNLTQQIADLNKGGPLASQFTSNGETPQISQNEFAHALQNLQTQLKQAQQGVATLTPIVFQESQPYNSTPFPSAPTTAIGEGIANAAFQKQIGLDRAAYSRRCMELARETVQSVTHAFDKVWDRSPDASALTNLARFKAAGLAKPYKPGMALPPGSMLFSQTMGEGSGHVQTVGDNGNRFDQHGENYYALKNFQWYVPPPGTPGARKGAGGALSDDQMSAVQADRDDTYSVTHDDYQNRRHDAYQRYDEDVSKAAGDPVALKAAKERLHAFLADIAKDKKKQDDEDAALQAKQTARLEKTQDTQISIAARHATSLAGTMASIYGTQGDLDAAGSDPVRFAKERAAAQEAFQHSVRAISNDSTGIGRFPSQEQIKDTIAAYRLMQTRLAEVATEQGTYDADQADKEQAKADRVQAKEDKRQKDLYLTDKQANGAGYLSYLNNQDQSAKSSGDDDRDASLQQDIAGVQAPSSAIAAATAEAQKALWKTAGGSMNEYFQDERTQLAAQADDFAKSGVAQDEIDTYVALKGKVIDAEQAAATTTKAFDALKEEFEDGKLSAIRYEEALRALAATSSDPAQEKLLDDAIRGAGKDAEKANPYNALADSFKGDIGTNIVGKFFDEMIEKGKLAKNFFKSFVEDMKKMIAELLKDYAMGQLFGARFGGGMNFSGAGAGGGNGKGSGIGNLLGGLFGQSKSNGLGPTIPQTSPQWPVVDQAPNVAGGGVAQGSLIANLFGPQAGAPTSGPSTPSAGAPGGGAGGASALAGMAPLLTKGVGSLFGSGAGAGFAAAMPWIGGGLLAAQLLFGKKFHLFSEGGVVPGVGVHDRVPAMLTPGEGVLTRDQMRAGSGGGGRGMPPITINHYGDVNGVEGLNTMADTIGYHVYQRLPVATS